MDPFPITGRYGLTEPPPVDQGWIRRAHRGPQTVEQVLARGLQAMLDQDERERQADPLTLVQAPRERRNLLSRLLRR